MRPKTIIGIVLILVFTGFLLMNFGQQVGGYMNFSQAEESGSRAHVVGDWVEERAFQYNVESNVFSFHMRDDQGAIREVRYNHPKPPNFEDAEKIVVEGRVEKEIFLAENILIKCPSKYEGVKGLDVVPDDVPDLTGG
ncbi:MAG: cytochrome c maturation protein CcmE [Bacteroidetes bacterium]|nr:cytochrome c maturation protein CcmE [Bacteroidota bacterium]